MLTDLVQIRRLGEKQREENNRFRLHLKRHDFTEKRLRRIAEHYEEEMDCTECANCCRVATVKLVDRDIEKLARFLRISTDRFLSQYTERAGEGLILKRTTGGCIFLQDNLCSVYEARPATCDRFPHLVRGQGSLEHRMWAMIGRACYCPIVYNTLEAWKEETRFKTGKQPSTEPRP